MSHPSGSREPCPSQEAIRARCFHPSGVFVEFRKEEIEQSIPDRFEQQVAKYPNRIAVKTRNHTLTYGALNKGANRVARAILAQRGEVNEPIALLLEQGASLIAAIIGILKAGKIYVPLDPYHPQAWLTFLLEDSQATLIVTNTKNLPLAYKLVPDTRQLINIDELDSSLSGENPSLSLPPESIACVYYTSGSTGQPKGVMQSHRNVLHDIMNYTNKGHIGGEDRLVLLHSCSFVTSLKVILVTLLNGAALYPFDLLEEGVSYLADWLISEKITIGWFVSTVYRHFVSTLSGESEFPALRLIILGGESVSKQDVEAHKKYFSPNCLLVVLLAATEIGTVRLYFIDKATRVDGSTVPVGYEVPDKEVLLLDEAGERVGFNGIGEIAVKSRYLASGYWRRPDLTQAKFLPDPEGGDKRIYLTGDLGRTLPDGCLEHIGRKDFQVKIRGHRIDPIEIEAVLGQHPGVRDTVVLAGEGTSGYKPLVAYVVPSQAQAPAASDLRNFLKERLPDYMVPSAFMVLDSLPLTPNGKVDRRALPVPAPTRPDLGTPFVAPRNPTEEVLGGIWSEVLGIDQVGIIDNFFELGGDSLLATTVISRVIQRFQVELPVQLLFQNPTVAGMAVVIMQNQAKKAGKEEMAGMVAELELLPDKEARRLLTEEAETERRREKWIEKTEKTIRSTK